MIFFAAPNIIKRKDPKKSFLRLLRSSSWPLKTYVALFFAFFSGMTLLLLSRTESPLTLSLQKTFLDASGHFFSFFYEMRRSIVVFKEAVVHRHTWFEEKKRLETENLVLHQKLVTLESVNQENKALRQLLNVVQKPEGKSIVTSVLSSPLKNLNHTFLIGAGALQGIRKGHPVLSPPYGIVGQVDQVGENVSRVMPLTHRHSRIPVIGVSSRIEAIVAGDGSEAPVLTYLQENKPLTPAEVFVSSRYGGKFPYGYTVGRLQEDKSGQVRLRPFIVWDHLEFVQVMTDSLPQTPQDQDLLQGEGNP